MNFFFGCFYSQQIVWAFQSSLCSLSHTKIFHNFYLIFVILIRFFASCHSISVFILLEIFSSTKFPLIPIGFTTKFQFNSYGIPTHIHISPNSKRQMIRFVLFRFTSREKFHTHLLGSPCLVRIFVDICGCLKHSCLYWGATFFFQKSWMKMFENFKNFHKIFEKNKKLFCFNGCFKKILSNILSFNFE